MQTLREDYQRVSTTNIEYNRNRERWIFLLNSFIGGDEYRRAGYLTKYQLETGADYKLRCDTTPLDNHCSSTVGIYLSFLFRENPDRDFKDWEGFEDVEAFLEDADLDGRSLDHFMKDMAMWSLVFGHSWCIMTKPDVGAETAADEDIMGARPYVNLLSPLSVLDWTWERQPTGRYKLVYFKYIEEILDKVTVVKVWTPETIETWHLEDDKKEAQLMETVPNGLGMIPAILNYAKRSAVRGQGVSLINDIADIQRMIYNLTSEIEQGHRLEGHPSLVVPQDAEYGSGAGSLVVLPVGSDPGLKPYYLQHSGANITTMHASIQKLVEAIDRLAHTGGVRGIETKTLSGVAMEVEMSLLSARLAEAADNLELTEEQMWRLFGVYQGRVWSGEVEYPGNFNVRDEQREIQQLAIAKQAATNPKVLNIIDGRLVELLGEEEDVIFAEEMQGASEGLPAEAPFEPHIMKDPVTGKEYIARTEAEHLAYAEQGFVHEEEY